LRLSWKILLCGLVMAAVLYPLRGIQGWATLAAILVAAIVYSAGLLLTRAIKLDELRAAGAALRPRFG
jgi:hypothetical protein